MSDQLFYLIRNTQGVLGFVGSSSKDPKPKPVSIYEYEFEGGNRVEGKKSDITINIKASKSKSKVNVNNIHAGMDAKVVNGPFSGEVVYVKSVDLDKNTAGIEIDLMGRKTAIDISLNDLITLE
jgi:transcriptional antiterminator NusG